MKLMKTEPSVYPYLAAKRMVEALQRGDDEWTYELEPVNDGVDLFMIKVLDENGVFVAHVTL